LKYCRFRLGQAGVFRDKKKQEAILLTVRVLCTPSILCHVSGVLVAVGPFPPAKFQNEGITSKSTKMDMRTGIIIFGRND